MKKIITLIAGTACLLCFVSISAYGQWTTSGTDIYNSNTGNVGIGNSSPGYLLHVGKNMVSPSIRIHNMGGTGGAAFDMVDNNSGASWKFKATNAGGFKIRDHASGLDVILAEQNSSANAIYIKQAGNVGIGLTNPLEKLHVNGAVLLGNTANSNSGAIRWNGSNFLGYNGSSWVNLDFNWTDPWVLGANIPFGNPEFSAGPQPMSLSFAFPGVANPLARLYVTDMSGPALFPHLLALETITGGAAPLDASLLYRISTNLAPPNIDYSVGIFGIDGTYKVCLGAVLTPTAQSDNTTLIRAYPSGIVDFNNQSRVRAYQVDPNGFSQAILPGVWTPVNFNLDSPLPVGYDEQGEFTLAAAANQPTPVENAYFTAATEGYYQVNARCEFDVASADILTPQSYVSIAIFQGTGPGLTVPYAIGNNLQIAYSGAAGEPIPLFYNNAPNVSDVVYLLAGEIISIWVWQSGTIPMWLIQGPDKLYVSIHKVS